MILTLKLQDFGWERFPKSNIKCPQCGEFLLEDNWPPNYCMCVSEICLDLNTNEQFDFKANGSQKYVCLNCKCCSTLSYEETNGKRNESWSEFVPLVEINNTLCTPNDVWREKYKTEHGEYPFEAYC